ncbi:hypothetical protein LTR84_009670 [Exophiala bonariae]|uniref:Zn(2)-C6 fungal-type domain-containing protein n=1 Tax=Exophiala bonariae TaxID=1690606 RepID=A0AAV9NKI6_9EURO|nr:hypothetical protein LTR84_009670 [Exophiala bonariae]
MTKSTVTRERSLQARTKSKGGCQTCRIRKVKCAQNKPFCNNCISTGRKCDGYKSPFIFCNSPGRGVKLKPDSITIPPALDDISAHEIELLGHYFSTKSIHEGVKLGLEKEARQVLQASLTDPPIQHAVKSLRALREDLEREKSGDLPVHAAQKERNYNYGIQQYSMALNALVSNMSSPDFKVLKSALLCCQIFIGIEQLQKNYSAMAQHIIRGLRIMHESRVRPTLTATNSLEPAVYAQLPLVDVFIVKLFAAPCKFAEPPAIGHSSGSTSPAYSITPPKTPVGSSQHCTIIAPNSREKLVALSTSTLAFLDKVSQVNSSGDAHRLLSEKAALLDSLDQWLSDLELLQTKVDSPGPESISISFLRCFRLILKTILLGALDCSPKLHDRVQTETDQLQIIADGLTERLKNYQMRHATR